MNPEMTYILLRNDVPIT